MIAVCKHCRHDYFSHYNFGEVGHCCARPGPSDAMCSCEQYERLEVDPTKECPDGCLHVQGDHSTFVGCQHLTPVFQEGWLAYHDRCKCRWPAQLRK